MEKNITFLPKQTKVLYKGEIMYIQMQDCDIKINDKYEAVSIVYNNLYDISHYPIREISYISEGELWVKYEDFKVLDLYTDFLLTHPLREPFETIEEQIKSKFHEDYFLKENKYQLEELTNKILIKLNK